MAEPCSGLHESSPGDSSPTPASQGIGSGGAEADVGRKLDEVVHLLEKVKESVTELREDVAGIKAEVEDVHKKIKAEAERAVGKTSIAHKIWRNLIKPVATVSGLGVVVTASCLYAIIIFWDTFINGGKK